MGQINVSANDASTNLPLSLLFSPLSSPLSLFSLGLTNPDPALPKISRAPTPNYLQNYFSDPWNVFDFVIVLGSFIDITYSEMNVSRRRRRRKTPAPCLFTRCLSPLVAFFLFSSFVVVAVVVQPFIVVDIFLKKDTKN